MASPRRGYLQVSLHSWTVIKYIYYCVLSRLFLSMHFRTLSYTARKTHILGKLKESCKLVWVTIRKDSPHPIINRKMSNYVKKKSWIRLGSSIQLSIVTYEAMSQHYSCRWSWATAAFGHRCHHVHQWVHGCAEGRHDLPPKPAGWSHRNGWADSSSVVGIVQIMCRLLTLTVYTVNC